MVTKLTAITCLIAAATVTAIADAGHTASTQQISVEHQAANASRAQRVASHGPDGGPACTLAVAPSAPKTIYVGTTIGVFRSVNGGRSWAPAGFAGPTGPYLYVRYGCFGGVTSLTVDPRTPTTLYAGLNERYQPGEVTYRRPVFKSTNGGRSWHALALRGQPIAISPTDPATVYATAGGAGGTSRLYRSTDGGGSWQPADRGLPSTYLYSLAFDPTAPTTAYAAMGTDGIFESSDSGGSWRAVRQAPPGGPVTAIAVDPRRPHTVYTATDAGLLKSLDGGGSWRMVNAIIGSHNRDRGYGQVSALVVDPRASQTLYATTVCAGVFKSTDGGRSWRPANTGLEPQCASADSLALDPQAPLTLYAADPHYGVFKSLDGGAHWRAINDGLSVSTVFSLAADPQQSGTVYAAAGDGGLFKTSDGGTQWRSLASGPKLVDGVTLDPSDPRTILAVAAGYGIVRSDDAGRTWKSGIGSGPRSVAALAIRGTTAYAGGRYLFGSRDGGRTWHELRALSTLAPFYVEALAIAPSDPAVAYAGITGLGRSFAGGLYKTTDGGNSWRRLITKRDANAIALDPTNPATIYVAEGGAVFKSADGGTTWQSASSGLPRQAFLAALTIDPAHPTTLYAADHRRGVFRSTNSGRTWQPFNAGLQGLDVRSLAIDANGRTVYAGTSGGGVVSLRTAR